VRDHDDGFAVLPVQRLEQVQNLVPGLAVQVAGRLVAQQQGGVGDNRSGDAHALLLPAGKLARIMFRPLREAHDGQRRGHVPLPLGAVVRCVSNSGNSTLRSAVSTGSRL
jgi:hypothetical protein